MRSSPATTERSDSPLPLSQPFLFPFPFSFTFLSLPISLLVSLLVSFPFFFFFSFSFSFLLPFPLSTAARTVSFVRVPPLRGRGFLSGSGRLSIFRIASFLFFLFEFLFSQSVPLLFLLLDSLRLSLLARVNQTPHIIIGRSRIIVQIPND